jgi:hypothetical protein
MPVEILELGQSDGGTEKQSHQKRYFLRGSTVIADIYQAMRDTAPTTIGTLVRQPPQADPIPGTTDGWFGVVDYAVGSSEPYENGESSFSMKIGGGTAKMTQAIAHVEDYVATGVDAPKRNHGGAIGVDAEGGIEGVEVPVPGMEFSRTLYVATEDMTQSWAAQIFFLCGRKNDAPWTVTTDSGRTLTFDAGEVTFLFQEENERGKTGGWVCVQHFRAEPNLSNASLSGFTGITKDGADYIWFEFGPVFDDAAKAKLTKATHAHVEQTALDGDFNNLEPT